MDDPKEKPAGRYAPGNEAEDGSYKVGKGKPPESGKYRKDDGRPRGGRAKGTRNFRTDFEEEMASAVTVSVNGEPRQVTRQRSIIMRLTDNASRGQNAAIRTTLHYKEKFDAVAQAEAAQNQEMVEEETAEDYPCLDDLTPEERFTFTRLWIKMRGPAYTPPDHPLAYLEDPDDPRNWYLEGTYDGLHYRRCTIPAVGRQLTSMDNLAYRSTALGRKQIFDRTRR